ncbi:unnamed protein product [Urochloa decumbens]|uniref:Uncharacterized protein n=1 Tax=Urochloa decumbens TaxID=240449 RepID=A0ABC9FVK3_9POAL
MELPPWASFLGVVLATVMLLKAVLRRRSRRAYNLPPGPKPWPVIGNLDLMGALPHRSIHDLSRKYGPLMQLRFGSFPVVVGSSVDMAKFFLKTHDVVFTDRPKTAAGKYTTYNYRDITWSPYGAYWRQARKMCLTELFSAKRLESYEYIRAAEVRALLRDLHGAASGSGAGAPVMLKDYLSTVSLNVITRMVLGKKYLDKEEVAASPVTTPEEFKWMLDELFLLNGVLNIGDSIPWLDWMDLQGYIKRMKKLSKMFDGFLEHVVEEHNQRRLSEGKSFVAKDMVDVLLQIADDPTLEVELDRESVKAFTQDLIAGGTESSAVTVEWAISELLKKPEVFAKATEELDRVIGRGRWVTEKDIPHLPYVDAIVKETMPGARGRHRGRLRHPRRHARARQRVDHRPRPGAVGRARGVHAGAIPRQQARREGAGLRAAAVRVRAADVPRVQPWPEGHPGEPRQPAARVRVEPPKWHDQGGAEHGGDLRPVHAAQVPARGRRRAQAAGAPLHRGCLIHACVRVSSVYRSGFSVAAQCPLDARAVAVITVTP